VRMFVGASIVLALVTSGQALAQPETGSIINQFDRASIEEGEGDTEAQQAIYDYGECLVKARARQVERFLAAEPYSSSSTKIARQIVFNACLDAGEIQFDPEAIRGPFYQALYRTEFRNSLAVDLGRAPALDYSDMTRAANGNSGVLVSLRRFADCVVRQDAGNVRALAFSQVGSAQESDAYRSLRPAMGSCIAPGDKVAFKPPLLRAVLNEVLYRLSAATVGRPMPMDRK
jgi:hypothetical protein